MLGYPKYVKNYENSINLSRASHNYSCKRCSIHVFMFSICIAKYAIRLIILHELEKKILRLKIMSYLKKKIYYHSKISSIFKQLRSTKY